MSTLVTTFPARVYASTPFDAVNQLVALQRGALLLLDILHAKSTAFASRAAR